VVGFLDSNPDALAGCEFPFTVLGDPVTWKPSNDEVFAAGIGDPLSRVRVCRALETRGASFITVVHPSAITGLNVILGTGCILSPGTVISTCVRLEDFVYVNVAASVGHDARIGEGTTLSPHCDVMGRVEIGRMCCIGSHACILPGKKVGDNAIVGAGSSVVRNVAPNTTVMGVPAQLLYSR